MDDFSIGKDTIVSSSNTARTLRRADVMFLLDCTGTMENTLNVIKTTINDVAEMYEKSKVQIRLGLVEYRDLTQPHREEFSAMKLHKFSADSSFTADVDEYKAALATLSARGGGPLPESTWDAMAVACNKADWDEKADKVMVLFSDAIPYRTGKEVEDAWDLCNLLKNKKIDQLHFVIDREDPKKIERFTHVLRNIPDVRDPRLTIFGSTYSISSSSGTGQLEHLKRVLLNIAKTSGEQAGGNTSGSNPYADAASTRQPYIDRFAEERKQTSNPVIKPKAQEKKVGLDEDEQRSRSNKPAKKSKRKRNPYS